MFNREHYSNDDDIMQEEKSESGYKGRFLLDELTKSVGQSKFNITSAGYF